MESPYDVLGVPPDATLSQIETAFQKQWTFWNDLRSNANRAAAAEAMIARLEFAHAQALARFQGQEGSLVDPAPTTQSGFGGSGVFASVQSGTTKPIDKEVCPKCGMREDSPDAVYCTNRECRFELKPCCPGCDKRIPWYKEICPYCGIDIEEKRQEILQREETRRNTQIQEVKSQLHDLQSDLAWVQSRSGLSPSDGKSEALLKKYGITPRPINGCLVGGMGAFALLLYLAGVFVRSYELLILLVVLLVGLVIISVSERRSVNKQNKSAVEQRIEERIVEVKKRLFSLEMV